MNNDAAKQAGYRKNVLLLLGLLVMGGLLLSIYKTPPGAASLSGPSDPEATNRSTASVLAALQKTRANPSERYATAEEEVAARLKEFTAKRRELTSRFAETLGIELPAEVQMFFDTAEKGDYAALKALWDTFDFNQQSLHKIRGLLQETLGVHEQVQTWPAQALLDYGSRVLAEVEEGSVYFGGTDAGRFIPTLLNETGDGSSRIILTQNLLADSSYVDYLRFLYADRIAPISAKNSETAFADYLADARRRLEHDRNFPNEPKQVRSGENIGEADGRIQVSGVAAVMAINERLLQMFREANPGVNLAFEESFSLPSTYAGAVPKGMLISLPSGSAASPISPEMANQTISAWKESANQWLNKPDFQSTPEVGRSYAQLLVAHGNLFQSQKLFSQAEQAFRLAQKIAPTSRLPLDQLAALLNATGRGNEAVAIVTAANQLR